MAVISLLPETKIVDAGKLISLGNLLVRKIMWFVLSTTFAPLILSRAFGADHMIRICLYILSSSNNSFSHVLTYRDCTLFLFLTHFDSTHTHISHTFWLQTHTHKHTHTHTHTHSLSLPLSLSLSLSLSLFLSTSRNSLTLPVGKTQHNTRNMGAYTFCNLFLSCSAFSVRLIPASNTASEISSNPERDKQATWEKTRSS